MASTARLTSMKGRGGTTSSTNRESHRKSQGMCEMPSIREINKDLTPIYLAKGFRIFQDGPFVFGQAKAAMLSHHVYGPSLFLHPRISQESCRA
jgi:hypothetical protein